MFDWQLLTSLDFWFGIHWNPLQPKTAVLMTVCFVLWTLIGVTLWFAHRLLKTVDAPLRHALTQGGTVFVTTGLLGLFFTFTAYEQAGLLSVRGWFLVDAVLFLVWGARVWWVQHIAVPAHREAASMREKLDKYFPKKK